MESIALQEVSEPPGKNESVETLSCPPTAGDKTAIMKVDKSEAPLPTADGLQISVFELPPIDSVLLSHMKDAELFSQAKTASNIYAQAGSYAKELLSEIKRRYVEDKKTGKRYRGHTNFDALCEKELNITGRQARNILNDNPGGRKGRKLPPRPKVSELKARNKALKEHVEQVEAANDRAAEILAQQAASQIGPTPQQLEQAKKDAVRDHQKIATKEKQESEEKVARLEAKVRKLSAEYQKLQSKQRTSKSAKSKEEAVSRIVGWAVSVIKPFPVADKLWIVDEVTARLRNEPEFDDAVAAEPVGSADQPEQLEEHCTMPLKQLEVPIALSENALDMPQLI